MGKLGSAIGLAVVLMACQASVRNASALGRCKTCTCPGPYPYCFDIGAWNGYKSCGSCHCPLGPYDCWSAAPVPGSETASAVTCGEKQEWDPPC